MREQAGEAEAGVEGSRMVLDKAWLAAVGGGEMVWPPSVLQSSG